MSEAPFSTREQSRELVRTQAQAQCPNSGPVWILDKIGMFTLARQWELYSGT